MPIPFPARPILLAAAMAAGVPLAADGSTEVILDITAAGTVRLEFGPEACGSPYWGHVRLSRDGQPLAFAKERGFQVAQLAGGGPVTFAFRFDSPFLAALGVAVVPVPFVLVDGPDRIPGVYAAQQVRAGQAVHLGGHLEMDFSAGETKGEAPAIDYRYLPFTNQGLVYLGHGAGPEAGAGAGAGAGAATPRRPRFYRAAPGGTPDQSTVREVPVSRRAAEAVPADAGEDQVAAFSLAGLDGLDGTERKDEGKR